MKSINENAHKPATLLFWTLTDEVIDRPEVLERQFDDIRRAGFGGVAAWVRCTRYNWFDPKARQALRRIGRLCKNSGIHSWIGPDPRFVSRQLIPPEGGLQVLLFGDQARANVFPNFAPVVDGRFSARCSIAPRHVHTLQEVAIEYAPQGLERVYAMRIDDDSGVALEVKDITAHARLFYNAREHYVEAFGELPGRFRRGEWKVLAFFRALTNHLDFSDRGQMRRYWEMLKTLRREDCLADAAMWDEPGFTCTYGTLPYSSAIQDIFERSRGRSIVQELWKLAVAAKNKSHVPVRVAYYQAIQRLLNDANERFAGRVKRLWGDETIVGIHDTWHFESADMCDMNHGSMDLWQAAKSKTGGFVDLGGIDKLKDPGSLWNAHLAAMSVICASLGKISSGGYAYNNLWTVGDDNGEGWQATVMDHCVNTMALFGTRWLAHCYGPVGTIGEEQSFLGSPPMPGYPNHSTWRHYPSWNRRLNDHLATVEQKLPESNLLLLFPVTALYAKSGLAADRAAAMVFDLVLSLLDQHYHVDVLSRSACTGARWRNGEFVVGERKYQAVIAPLATAEEVRSLGLKNRRAFVVGPDRPKKEDVQHFIGSVLAWLETFRDLRPVTAPAASWVTMTAVREGTLVTLSPSRYGYRYCGEVRLGNARVELQEEWGGLTRIHFPPRGEAWILPNNDDYSLENPAELNKSPDRHPNG